MSRRKDTGFTKESHVSGLNACLVVAATTFNYFLVGAVQYSQGLMFREVLDEFRAGKLTTSWLCGLLLGLMNLSAMFTCWLDGLVSYRTMSLVGSVLICCGMVGSSFVSNINILFFTYGTLIGGFFTCLSVVIVDLFQKEFISSVWVFAHLAQTLSFLTSSYIHAKFSEATAKPQMALLLAGLFECTGGFLHLFYFVFVYRRRKNRSTSK